MPGLVLVFIGYRVVFRKSRYDGIMQEFAAYNPTAKSSSPATWLLIPMIPVAMISAYAIYPEHDPVIPNVLIWSILVLTETLFRIWWRWWCKRHVAAG